MQSLTDAMLDFWLTTGRFSKEFEKNFAEWIGVKYAHLVNSGSSANLIAFSVLTAPELGDRQIKKGDEVITVACGFPTTINPIIQYGAVPVFLDVTVPQYNIDETNTGIVIIETIEGRQIDPMAVPGIVVKNHGPFAWGKSPANAVYNAVVMEKVAEMDLKTLFLNPNAEMKQYVLDKHYMRKHGPNAYYGQK